MNNYTKRLIIFSVGLVIPVLPLLAHAQGPEIDDEQRKKIFEQLNLTDEQKQVLKDYKKSKMKVQKMMLQAKLERMELNELLAEDKISESKIMSQLDKVNKSIADLNSFRVKNMLSLKKTLSPEQMHKLRQVARKKFKDRVGEFRQEGHAKGHFREHFKRKGPGSRFEGKERGGFERGNFRDGPGPHNRGPGPEDDLGDMDLDIGGPGL